MLTTLDKSMLFCPVCDYLMSTYEDQFAMSEFSCCHNCFLTWAESRKKEWKEGWRPSKEEIQKQIVLKKRIILQ